MIAQHHEDTGNRGVCKLILIHAFSDLSESLNSVKSRLHLGKTLIRSFLNVTDKIQEFLIVIICKAEGTNLQTLLSFKKAVVSKTLKNC